MMFDLAGSILAHWLIVLAAAPFLIGVIAQVKARIAGKRGPSLLQPYFDLARLLQKQCVYSQSTTWIFRMTPPLLLALMLIIALFIPLGPLKAPVSFPGDILLVAYLFALGRFFMILSALDTGFSMEGMGASREAFFACLAETTLFINFITLAILAQETVLSQMIGAAAPLSWSLDGPSLILVTASFFIVLLTENCRIPVDDPDTHLELTMVHEVMLLDHSGVDLAYMLDAAAMKLFIFAGMLVAVIVPVRTGSWPVDMLIFAGGMLGVAIVIGLIESSMARLRLNRVRNFLLIASALAFFGLVVTLWRG